MANGPSLYVGRFVVDPVLQPVNGTACERDEQRSCRCAADRRARQGSGLADERGCTCWCWSSCRRVVRCDAPAMSFDTPRSIACCFPPLQAGPSGSGCGRMQGRPTKRRVVALAVRLLVFAALILAAAGMTLERPTGDQAVAFVADLSASTEGGKPVLSTTSTRRCSRADRAT